MGLDAVSYVMGAKHGQTHHPASDNGKVVVDGALVEQTTAYIDFPGVYDTTTNDEVVVSPTFANNWQIIRGLVSSGAAETVLPPGSIVPDKWGSYSAPWDVVNYDPNGDMVLRWHYATKDAVQFDAPEAIYYAGDGGLAAGTYHINIGTAYGTGWATDKHIQFTLTRAMVKGDQLYIDCATDNATDPTNGRTWKVFHAGGTEVLEQGTTSNGTDGTELGTIGAESAQKTNGLFNAISRVVYGSDRWSESAIRQYLNSAANAGAWWTAKNGWDRPPSQHTSLAGFLKGFSEEFLSILEPVEVTTALNAVEGFSANTETTMDKIFLPSLTEMYIDPQYTEGAEWDYYKTLAQEAGLRGKFQQYSTYAVLKKYNVASKSSSVHVWLRSCRRSSAYVAWFINSGGTVSYGDGYAYSAYRGCPACKIRKDIVYSYHIDGNESDPYMAVSYGGDNVNYTPAHMDFANDKFEWGSWSPEAFFIPRPCMLRYDGTVDYYLDPDDYSLREDGTPSDIASDDYGGNAMMEWGRGGRKIWYKIVPDEGDNTSATVYIANHQADADYRCWSFINNVGDLVDHFYTPIYNGGIVGSRLRSLSGKSYSALCQGKTVEQEVELAQANNPAGEDMWYTEVMADVTLINLILILMGKSLNTQAMFGNGRQGQTSAASSMLSTGTMNTKGLFWGAADNTHGIKVLGMENVWGNQWRRYAGHVMINYVHKVKYTRGTQDGSTATDYNTDGTGYLSAGSAPQTNDFRKTVRFDANGFVTASVGGTSAAYWCDAWYQNSGTRYVDRGGSCSLPVGSSGAFCVAMHNTAENANWYLGAAPSCKPLL